MRNRYFLEPTLRGVDSHMYTKRSLLLVCGLSGLVVMSGIAAAQAPPTPTTPPERIAPPPSQSPVGCEPMGQDSPRALEDSTVGHAKEPISDKLARSDGVLCPPSDVDRGMRAPAPDIGKTPIIPPPGSPGGEPSIRPK
jgi:hypothetical protein